MLAEGGEDSLPLTDWVISPPYTKLHTADEMWEVCRTLSFPTYAAC